MVNIIEANNISKNFSVRQGMNGKKSTITAVDNVSFSLREGQSVGIVGESGSGKSTLVDIVGDIKSPSSGEVLYYGKNIRTLKKQEYRDYRRNIQFVFQSPKDSLHPYYTVKDNLLEPLKVFEGNMSRRDMMMRVRSLLDDVQLDESYLHQYPRELSGGQAQRVCIARALSLRPKVIICDEAVSALDLSVQAQIIDLLKTIKGETNFIFISHDIAAVNEIADYGFVLKDGQMVEESDMKELVQYPQDEYTKALIKSAFYFEEV
ncbi:ABC transporter ATP-binding protein [Aliicoccus persicus]|uniref:Peptide/nickel transport system ATP-binding protein n=1 Tax=Aliicoccus persicus TaxID=930138 RepID=A0A662Z662_9STAP|nr:dipeptide/oligopeptide/nickel ABC transporter ATP-binding protein [Aliicoccus persicus]SEV95707.1 peptide/nickel transport system ATP-binding protein [Aliicoccus persicus]